MHPWMLGTLNLHGTLNHHFMDSMDTLIRPGPPQRCSFLLAFPMVVAQDPRPGRSRNHQGKSGSNTKVVEPVMSRLAR